jgi:5-formyltetrahydrofolate cyclo-ligase
MLPIREEKDQLRARYKKLRAEMDGELKSSRDKRICRAAEGLISFRYADCVLMYCPSFGEIDIQPIALAALEKGKRVAYPRCDKSDCSMKYHFVESLDLLAPDAYGIPEPPVDAPVYNPDKDGTAVCYVPGLAFDSAGYRLGYGKGYYDRFLSGFHGYSVGIVYSDYILKSVPRGRYDMKVDILLTEKGVRMTDEG